MEIKEIKENEFESEVENSKGMVLVDFYATWCGPCKMIRPILEELSKEVDTKIMSIDVDDASSVAGKYGILSIPCLILFKDGKEINRSVGLKSKKELNEFIKGE